MFRKILLISLIIGFCGQMLFAAWPKIIQSKDIKHGMLGEGWTTFEGYTPQKFNIRIIGLENWWLGLTGIKVAQVKCFGGPNSYPMSHVGVASGMSGSPIYVYTPQGTKLLGALAYRSYFNKDPICGVILAEKMLAEGEEEIITPVNVDQKQDKSFPLIISGPFNFLTNKIIQEEFEKHGFKNIKFLPQGGATSLREMVDLSSQLGSDIIKMTPSKLPKLQPGSPITAYLTIGDICLGAHGTVTMVNNETGEFYAFGHPLLGTGLTSIPVAIDRVETVVANYAASYKMFEKGGPIIGSLTKDFTYGVKGKIGQRAEMIKVNYNLSFRGITKPVNVSVAKIPNWTNRIIFILNYYTILGGYEEFNLSKIDREGSAIIKMTLRGDFPDITLGSIQQFDIDNINRILLYYVYDIYNALDYLNKNKFTIKSIEFEIEYQTGRPNRLKLERAILEKSYATAGDSVKISLTFSRKNSHASEEVNITYKTIYTLKIPSEADNGKVDIQVKTGDYLHWFYIEKPTEEEIYRRITSLTNLYFFVKADFPIVNQDTTPFVIQDTSQIEVEGRIWQRKEEKQKPVKEITIFDKLTAVEKIMIEANETLTLEIVSKAEYDKRKKEEERAKKEEEAVKKKKKFGIW